MAKRTAQDIRRRNRFDALRCVFAASGPVSRQEVAAATGLSFATAANLVAELLEAGVLREAGHEDSKGGRPRARLAVNAERGALVGIDVAETSVQVELFDLALTVLRSVRLPLPQTDVRPDDVVDAIVAGVEGLSDATGAPPRILGAGVSIPGLVEREGGVSVFSPYWSWRDVPLRSLLAERLPMPLYLDNPLKAAAVAEMWFGAGREVDDLLVLTLRAGVGAGIAVDGALYRGATNSAGEWGHTCLVRDGRECRCGRQGCVEAYVSTRGIARTVRELDAESPLLDPDEDAVVSKVARAAAEGDAVATETVARTARYLGEAAADLLNLFNPQALVLGGWVADRLGEPLLRQTREVIAAHALPATLQALTFRLSTVPDNPVSLGAATFALEGFLDDRETFATVAAGRRAARAAKAGTS
ncbi:ROK family protein [Streptomyces sp. NBC_00273]|uniref:ROK family protein n=1 Tax=Streptomyces sp. NBC_00273 TaxID=2903644 RepID=UPI002E2CEA49|nr:ROK family protein [Streptomyces sp. NBC_00273]